MARKTVLLMWEYSCACSPIWARSPDLEIGVFDARDLGLPEALRDDLADWNDRAETAADPNDLLPAPTSPAAWRALMAESWPLAARLQRGLGDAWTVQCAAGGGTGGLLDQEAFRHTRRSGGPQLILSGSGLVEWSPEGASDALPGFELALRTAVHGWVAGRDRLPPAEHRARALELAGRLSGAFPGGRILWFGGAATPS